MGVWAAVGFEGRGPGSGVAAPSGAQAVMGTLQWQRQSVSFAGQDTGTRMASFAWPILIDPTFLCSFLSPEVSAKFISLAILSLRLLFPAPLCCCGS